MAIKSNEMHESSRIMFDLKNEIMSDVNEKLARINTLNRGKEIVDMNNSPTNYNPSLLRKLNMKVSYDVFELITAQKADKSYVDQIISVALNA